VDEKQNRAGRLSRSLADVLAVDRKRDLTLVDGIIGL
jgi:hypothetical protein